MTALQAQLYSIHEGISRKRVEMGNRSPPDFAKVYLDHHFLLPPSRMHTDLFSILHEATQKRKQKIAIAAPRGHAKSTVTSLAYVLWSALYDHEPHILLLAATKEQAEQYLQNVKHELTTNERLLNDFPGVCQASSARRSANTWRSNKILLNNGVMIRALGAGQAVRGIKHRADRPSLILVDDLENQEQCESADQRRKTEDWFYKTLMKAGSESTNVIIVGTILHYDSLLAKLTYPKPERGKGVGWTNRIYQAVESFADRSELWDRWEEIYFGDATHEDETGPDAAKAYFDEHETDMLQSTRVLWPERETYLDLMEMKATEGRLSFQSEKQNEPLDPDTCIFTESSMKFWDDDYADVNELIQSIGSKAKFFGACDPSLGKRATKGDYTAIITLLCNEDTKELYVIDADIVRRKPDQTLDRIVALAMLYKYRYFAFEANQFQQVLANQLTQKLYQHNIRLKPDSVTHTSHKQTRIESLEPVINSGRLKFSRKHQLLLEQMRQFPLGVHDDGPDALEMAVEQAMRKRVISRVCPL